MFSTTSVAARMIFRKFTTPLTSESRSSWFTRSCNVDIQDSKESPRESKIQKQLQVSKHTAKVQQTLLIDQREVERTAPRLVELDKESHL